MGVWRIGVDWRLGLEYPFRLVGVVEKEAVGQYGLSLRSPLLARAITMTGYNGGKVPN